MKLIGKIALSIVVLALASSPLRSSAQSMTNTNTNKIKNKSTNAPVMTDAKAKPLPFNGKLGGVDNSAKTITLDEKTKRTFQITSETKLMKNGKPATLEDAVVGEEVRGSYKKTVDGKLSLVSASFGAKAAAPPVSSKSKKGTNDVSSVTNLPPK